MKTRLRTDINRWLDVPSADPDDARRRKLLNIILAGMLVIAIIGFLVTTITAITGTAGTEIEVITLYIGLGLLFLGIMVIFLINRTWSGKIASWIFLLLLLVIFVFSDSPDELVAGRSTFLYSIPILMASVVLWPWASFVLAGLSSLELTALSIVSKIVPPVPAMLSLFAIALVAWLAARSLENALVDLRTINQELDQRVEKRTRDLAESLSRNEAILKGIADGVIVFDNDGMSTMANPAMIHILGKSNQEIVGHELGILMQDVNQNDQEVIYDLVKDSLVTYPSLKFEWGIKTISASFAAVRDNVGRRTGTVAVFRDFTREAELERMKSTFVSSISHELRTPLNAILGYSEILTENVYGPLLDGQRNAINRVTVNSKRLLSIVNDLLDQAQIEAGTLKLKVAPFSPSSLIDGVIDVMDVLAHSKELELVTHIADDVPVTLPSDQQRLHQILINLVGNAIKFTDEGSVRMRIYRPNATQWALEVEDTGCGIPLEAQSYIFDPFQQVDSSATRTHSGSGLGLSIVRQLTALMGGEITLKSQIGKGSTFTVILPLVPIQEEVVV
ncbi:MAG: PAS domain S-box protein [Chloroflexi bacterium]|nr:PAS domain S-box protein [Chloroflexota bacterium]